jgi:prepilin-type N-terminal cleavage/methylation domain-containing protein
VQSQRGFTLVEVLIVVAIIGILSNIAIPQVQEALWRARAASIVGDFTLVQKAALEFYRDNNRMPENGTVSSPAVELDAYLKGKVKWIHPNRWVGAYVWENWETKKHGQTTGIKYGFSLKTPNPELITAIRRIYDGPFEQTVFDKYTFPITAY